MNSSKAMTLVGNTYVAVMLLIFPLFLWPFDEKWQSKCGYLSMTSNKMTFHITALAILIASLLLLYAFRPSKPKHPEEDVQKPHYDFSAKGLWQWIKDKTVYPHLYLPDLFLVLFFVGGLITWLVAPYGDALNYDGQSAMFYGDGRYDGLLFYFTYALIYFTVSRFGSFKSAYIKAFAVVLLIMSLIAVIQLSGHNFMNFYPTKSHKGWHHNFVSTLGNVDITGGFLCTAVPLVGVGYVVFRLNRVFSALFLISHTVAIYTMLSIGVDVTLVTLPALTVIFLPILMRNRRYAAKTLEIGVSILMGIWLSLLVDYRYVESKKHTYTIIQNHRLTPLILGLMILLMAIWFVLQQEKWVKNVVWRKVQWGIVIAEVLLFAAVFVYFRFFCKQPESPGLMNDLYGLAHLKLADESGTHRVGIWRHCLMMCVDNLWFGTGCGTLADTFRAFAYKTNYVRYATPDRKLDFAHNEYIHYLCTQGLWGLLSYLGFLGSIFVFAFQYFKQNPKILVLAAGVMGYCIQVFFSFSIVIVAPFYWLLLGLLMKEIRQTALQQAA